MSLYIAAQLPPPKNISCYSAVVIRHPVQSPCSKKRRCEITIISFSRSICRGGLAALIGVTGKHYPSCLSCHSHPIRPFRAPSPRGEGCDTGIPSSKKGGEAATRALTPETNESKVKRSCEEMRIHFFTAPLCAKSDELSPAKTVRIQNSRERRRGRSGRDDRPLL